MKRRDSVPPSGVDRQVFLDSTQLTQEHPNQEIGLRKIETSSAEEVLSTDVEVSLKNLETELDHLPEPGKESRHVKKLRRSRNRKEKRIERRHRHPIRRIIKWFFVVIFALLLVLIGWLVFKALMTGGKIFQGSILDIFTSKTRLAEDKNGRTNILIFGTSGYSMREDAWDGALLTDSIMIVSVDQDEHDAYMISLPRDLYVKHTCKKLLGTSAGKLNETYYCAYIDNSRDEEKGATALRKTAGEIVGLDIQYYVHANWSALAQAVDAVGGIDVVVESSDSRGIYDYETKLKLPNGLVHLDGERALAFARARGSAGGYGLPGGNFDREIHQQKVLAALQQKALSAGTLTNPVTVNSLLDALGDNLRTNFKTSEVQTLMDLAKNIKSNGMISLPLVNRSDGGPNLLTTGMLGEISIVRPIKGLYDYSDIINYVTKNINADLMTRESAKIDTKTTGTGYLYF